MTPYRNYDRAALAQVGADPAGGGVASTEFAEIYLPVARLIDLRRTATQQARRETAALVGAQTVHIPFIVGLAGSVAVGKSTAAGLLRDALAALPQRPNVALVPTDGFLFPNAELEARGILERKGFPESFDSARLIDFLRRLKAGEKPVQAPVYSHVYYDVMADQTTELQSPDIVIIEGVNALQSRPGDDSPEPVQPYSFFDFSAYIHAEEGDIKRWFTERFVELTAEAENAPTKFYHRFANLTDAERLEVADLVWTMVNSKNLNAHILPSMVHADLVLHKGPDHTVTHIELRHP